MKSIDELKDVRTMTRIFVVYEEEDGSEYIDYGLMTAKFEGNFIFDSWTNPDSRILGYEFMKFWGYMRD